MSSQPQSDEPMPNSPGPDSPSQGSWPSKERIIWFSSIAIGLYGYDQGMMSMVNTNRSYLRTMGIAGDVCINGLVGIIVSVYYLGCLLGSIIASYWADKKGRKAAVVACLITSIIGDIMMFLPGIYPYGHDSSWQGGSRILMILGRVVLGLGIGGIDAVVPVYSSEIAKDDTRGAALAKEFQWNIGGLLLAFAINLLSTRVIWSKDDQWAWRLPIIFMQVGPLVLLLLVWKLPESPRWFISKNRPQDAKTALTSVHGNTLAEEMFRQLQTAQQGGNNDKLGISDMVLPKGSQFRPTVITVMGQVNQALTGYGAVSVYGPQIFALLGLNVAKAEYVTLANYIFYWVMMTFAWKGTIDDWGRRKLMVWGSMGLTCCYMALTILGSASVKFHDRPQLWVEIIGSIFLFISTAIFGICWLATVWLIPTEIYPNGARAKGSAISVIVWGVFNFLVTLLTPIGFNHLKYWLFLVFVVTNILAGLLTWLFSPETGGRSFEENQTFFISAREEGYWMVKKVAGGKFLTMPPKENDAENAEEERAKDGPSETTPLLNNKTNQDEHTTEDN
ncbi:hypothetical protein M426DRAFT_320603 [Hypoxylon sp. CI-4A]|nr:hypothetical protein M426DRAFT_320603 [Hypoxylon sp. CI-4A]